jgi:kojibiose phosphorylase
MYHLIASVNPHDERCSIGARALTGEAYRGHVFWDTEIFMLPFFVHAFPEAARALLGYRYLTLDGARRKARQKGFRGALYPWESADTGDETTPSLIITPMGEIVRVLSGELEQHISADIAYAICEYARAARDVDFFQRQGLEILVETARFWASRVRLADGVAHIDEVIGPDEYHETVNDNAYTNWMASDNLSRAADAAERFGATWSALDLHAEEIARWRDIAARLARMQDPKTGLVEQFAGFHTLEYVDLSAYTQRTAPMDVLLGRERTQGAQVVKQSDVVQLLALFWDQFTDDARRANFLYYEPRTAHGSSLSPGIHALVAARLGLSDVAARYLDQTADIDLGNNMGNAAGGVHAAGMGSFWQAVVFGVGGARPAPEDEETLVLEPHLLPGWRHLGFPFAWRSVTLDIHIEPQAIELSATGDRRVRVRTSDDPADALVVEPSRRYVARFTGARYGRWEEVTS